MTTLIPREPYTDVELKHLYPADLELRQVQILLRHGERTPVGARFRNAGLAPYWPYCEAAKNFKDVILNADQSWGRLDYKRRLEAFAGDGSDAPVLGAGKRGEVDAICQPGELTDRGRETTRALGERIRKLYVDRLGFLPSQLDAQSAGSVYLRSTPIQRALESVEQAYTGLYPPSTRSPDAPPPVIVTRSMGDEVLFPNEGGCKRFAQLAAAFADRTAKLYSDGPELAYVNKKIGKWMPAESPVVKVDSHPRLSGVMDTINATRAHGPDTKLPREFYDEGVIRNVDRICTEEWFVGYQESNEYRKLGIGALVGNLTQRMVEHTTTSNNEFKISLSGCHDTTLAATLTSLGAFNIDKDHWPNFTSSIAFELFRRKDAAPPSPTGAIWPTKEKTWWYTLFSSPKPTSSPARTPLAEMSPSSKAKLEDYYVRLRYNDHPMTLPYCAQFTSRHLEGDETFCTLSAFKEAADSFTPRNWKSECKASDAPAMKAVTEPPPGVERSGLV